MPKHLGLPGRAEFGVVSDHGGQGLHGAFHWGILFTTVARDLWSAHYGVPLYLVGVPLDVLQELVPSFPCPTCPLW